MFHKKRHSSEFFTKNDNSVKKFVNFLVKCGIIFTRFHTFTRWRKTGMLNVFFVIIFDLNFYCVCALFYFSDESFSGKYDLDAASCAPGVKCFFVYYSIKTRIILTMSKNCLQCSVKKS